MRCFFWLTVTEVSNLFTLCFGPAAQYHTATVPGGGAAQVTAARRKRGEGEGEGTVFLGLSTSFMGMDGGGTLDLLTVSRSLRGKTALEVIVARKRGLTKPQPFLKLMVKISS